jgi:hypothetical protein
MVAKYTLDLPVPSTNKLEPLDGQTILLTGTTGSLGAYVLDLLYSSPRVKKVVALNRGEDGGGSRQPSVSTLRDLSAEFSMVDFVRVDISVADLGLEPDKYNELLTTADRIIHNAWPVNFNISIASFGPHISGVRYLVYFAYAATKHIPIVFVSSISTVDGWTATGHVPEQSIDDLTLPRMGYGRSKLASSLILDAATAYSGVPTASPLRSESDRLQDQEGQKGAWNRLIASSVHLGMLPQHLSTQDVIDWMPVEDVAGLVLDIAGITAPVPVTGALGIFPRSQPPDLAMGGSGQCPEGVSRRTYQEAGHTRGVGCYAGEERQHDNRCQPESGCEASGHISKHGQGLRSGTKTCLHGLRRLTARRSRTLAPVTPELMKHWCEQWGF